MIILFYFLQLNSEYIICLHSVYMSYSSIWPISGATTLGQNEPGSDSNEGVFSIPQSSWTVTSPSDYLVSYTGHSLRGGSYPSSGMQSVYSTVPSKWAIDLFDDSMDL